MHRQICVSMYLCMHAGVYACMCVCMYVSIYAARAGRQAGRQAGKLGTYSSSMGSNFSRMKPGPSHIGEPRRDGRSCARITASLQ